VKYAALDHRGEGNTAMKENSETRVVLVGRDSAGLARRRARAFDSFTTVRFEERKRAVAAAYGTFWYLMSRRFL
jgi:hypothetical protein